MDDEKVMANTCAPIQGYAKMANSITVEIKVHMASDITKGASTVRGPGAATFINCENRWLVRRTDLAGRYA